jgi:hypothetical protein
MAVEFKKPVSRKVSHTQGTVVVTLDKDSVVMRAAGKQKGVRVPLAQIAKMGLMNAGACLTEEEWELPVKTLRKLASVVG